MSAAAGLFSPAAVTGTPEWQRVRHEAWLPSSAAAVDASAALERFRARLGHGSTLAPWPALRELGPALCLVELPEGAYAELLGEAALALHRAHADDQALACCWFGAETPAPAPSWLQPSPPWEALEAWRRALRGGQAADFAAAARRFEAADRPVRAAIAHERAGAWDTAGRLWHRLLEAGEAGGAPPYPLGLLAFNAARCALALGDPAGGAALTARAVQRLEEAASRHEAEGRRDRAFDGYSVLFAIGDTVGAAEHVLAGAVNALRLLRADRLARHARDLYATAVEWLAAHGEPGAAATLARELADYAGAAGLEGDRAAALQREADLWRASAALHGTRGAPVELRERALLSAVLAEGDLGHFGAVGALFREAAALPLEPPRQARHRRAAERCPPTAEARAPAQPLPRGGTALPPDVWHADLVELETAAHPEEALADLLIEPPQAQDPAARRRALLATLAALQVRNGDPAQAAADAEALAARLGAVGTWTTLAPVEGLARHADARVRRAAAAALGRHYFKRSFEALERAVVDGDTAVRSAAVASVERLRFDHALEPLLRVARASPSAEARAAATRALARLELEEAALAVITLAAQGDRATREAAQKALEAPTTAALRAALGRR